ncbi:MAG TPA: glycerol kinase GlpK [Gemmatimonadales bacterium]|nr:glycerol kinase GlpK [Gemmatimonadales bacterium]
MPSILALDQGTTGSTALVVHADGRILGRGYREFQQHYPQPGWVEHDADEIFRVTLEAARDAIAASGEGPSAIGITNQRETVVLWDRATLAPVARAIVWQDRRTADRCRQLKVEGHADAIQSATGLVLDPYFSASKLEWLLRRPELRRRAERGELAAGTIDSWLVARLTGGRVHVTDHTNASRTQLYNLDRRTWDPRLLTLFGIPPEILPAIVPSAGVMAESDPSHLGRAIPIAGMAGDQQAALFGQGCVRPEMAKNTYGTGAFLLTYAGTTRPRAASGLLVTSACGPRGEPAYAMEGSVFVAGAAIQWMRDGVQVIAAATESEALARTVEDTGGVYFVPAFVGLGSPHWEPEARGTIVGLTRGTTRAHLVRAGLESIAFSSADLLQAMTVEAGMGVEVLRVDGGATANDWLMQFQADILATPVERPDNIETTALGAAALAGLAVGIWPSLDACLECQGAKRFTPQMAEAERETRWQGWRRALRATLAWAEAGSR